MRDDARFKSCRFYTKDDMARVVHFFRRPGHYAAQRRKAELLKRWKESESGHGQAICREKRHR